MRLMKYRNIKKMKIYPEFLKDFFTSGIRTYRVKDGLPKDAEFRGMWFDPETNILYAYFEHDSFPSVPEGTVASELESVITVAHLE